MPQISLIELLATTMLVAGDMLILVCAGSSGLALLFSFIRQRELFIRFWAGGLFTLLFALPAFLAKLSQPDSSSFTMGAVVPLTNLVGGILLAGAVIALAATLVVRKRFAYGFLS